jgi:aldose 1-epimerase
MKVRILTLGCIISRLEVPDRNGRMDNVVLGLDRLDDYLYRSPHFGAIAGRYANRIAGGRFQIDDSKYQLEINDGPNTLHGGRNGFDKKIWRAEASGGEKLTLRYLSPDGEEGFPGDLAVVVTYTVSADNELRIDYSATTQKPTVVNLTNHSYFNLAGEGSGDILNHIVSIESDSYVPTDQTQIPTGEIRAASGSAFDFSVPTRIGERIREADSQLIFARGYDHYWVLRTPVSELVRLAASALEPRSGRMLSVFTDAPGVQFYTANSLLGNLVGPTGRSYRQSDGFCFETQRFPDAPNQSGFPSALLRPGERFQSTTIFRFTTAGP